MPLSAGLHGVMRRTMSFSIRSLRADNKIGLTRSARTFHDSSCRSGALVISKSAYMWPAATVHNKGE
jgi:hypothetical protein